MFKSSKGVLYMVLVQIFATGLQLLSKVILSDGTFVFALMAYRHVVAALCVAPFAFFFERKNGKKLNWSIMCWLFINASTGISLAMGLYYYGLKDTTATYATNFLNLIPIVTFFFSVLIGSEKLGVETKGGKVKIFGAILCVGGALVVTLYKGYSFHIGHMSLNRRHTISMKTNHNWTRGLCLLTCSCISYAIWFIVQVKLSKVFPSKYTVTMLTCIVASLQSVMVGLCIDRRVNSWRLGWNLQLVTIVYSGAIATAATFCLISWAVAHNGPTYPPMFNPLTLIFVAFLEAILLGEKLSVGSLIGMCLIIFGLYSYLWGRKKESLKNMQTPNISALEVATTVPKPTDLQSSATVMPTNCAPPDYALIVELERHNMKSKDELQP